VSQRERANNKEDEVERDEGEKRPRTQLRGEKGTRGGGKRLERMTGNRELRRQQG